VNTGGNMIEEWKTIEGYNGYEVSNLARVKSFKRTSNGRIKKLSTDRPGYCLVQLWNNDKGSTKRVHQLVWDAFGDRPRTCKLEVDHKDENKLNNRIDNLQLLTHRENTSKSYRKRKVLPTGVVYSCSNPNQKKVYKAQIHHNGKVKYLGYYHTPEEASKVYQEALREIT